MWRRLWLDEDGQSLVEYGLILGLVSVALIGVLGTVKANLVNIFMEVGSALRKGATAVKTN
ncbi:MAG: Flp family type IVb pilin [Candidatus Sericytochromatia bacterium]|nr:Flp family type IVb pilin [Candidatus Sericytochromatia bacterium]